MAGTSAASQAKGTRRPGVLSLLLAVNLAALVLPFTGAWLFRFYDDSLLRETESELAAQAVIFAGAYILAVEGLAGPDWGIRHWNAPAADYSGTSVASGADEQAYPSYGPPGRPVGPAELRNMAPGENLPPGMSLAEWPPLRPPTPARPETEGLREDLPKAGGPSTGPAEEPPPDAGPQAASAPAGRGADADAPRRVSPLPQTSVALAPGLSVSSPPLPDGPLYSPPLRDLDPVAALAAERVRPILEEAASKLLTEIVILDPHGTVASQGKARGLSMARTEEVQGALDGSCTAVVRRGQPTGAAPGPGRTDYRVSVACPVFRRGRLIGAVLLSKAPRASAAALWQDRSRLLMASLAAAALLVALSLFASLRLIGPLKSLAARAREAARREDAEFRERAPGLLEPRELALLEKSVGLMAFRLKRRSEYLKAFARGVSHEFKTPLSSLKGALELLHDDSGAMPPPVRERFRQNVVDDLDRLESLAARLLALARAEATGPSPDARADAMEIARALCARLSADGGDPRYSGEPGELPLMPSASSPIPAGEGDCGGSITDADMETDRARQDGQAGQGGQDGQAGQGESVATPRGARASPDFRATVASGTEELLLAVDRDALETVLLNLLANSREAGAGLATVTLTAEVGYGTMEVTDDGPGVTTEDAARIFAPFFTTRVKKGGTGLGLSLCRTLLAPYGGTLGFTAPSTFRVTLPLWKGGPPMGKGHRRPPAPEA
jgi:signal transduction histidine kinase